jgi:hypothetical protein
VLRCDESVGTRSVQFDLSSALKKALKGHQHSRKLECSRLRDWFHHQATEFYDKRFSRLVIQQDACPTAGVTAEQMAWITVRVYIEPPLHKERFNMNHTVKNTVFN